MGIRNLLLSLVLFLVAHPAWAQFQDKTTELGLTMGTDQACWVDLDNDGFTDLCASGSAWRNEKGQQFSKLADVGLVAASDFDNDGFTDLFAWNTLTLWRNEKGKGFSKITLPALPRMVSRSACWGDFNNDGFTDLFIGGYEDWDKNITYPSLLLLNENGKRFTLAWSDDKHRSRGVTACDFNRDGALDIYVSNYRLQPNQLLRNDGKAHFTDIASNANAVATSPSFAGGHSIGACWGDFDNDGHFDLFTGNFAHVDSRGDQPKSRFLRSLGPSGGYRFDDKGPCGIAYQESYATPSAGNYDNDGALDLVFTTIYPVASFGKKNFPALYRNDGAFAFTNTTKTAGIGDLPATYQAAWADFDNDGDLDLVSGGKLFVNAAPAANRWLKVRLVGDGKRVNRSAVGAQVRIKLHNKTLTRQVEAGTGEGNQNDLVLHFGLGPDKGRVDLEVSWPDGKTQTVKRVETNRLKQVRYKPYKPEFRERLHSA